MYINRKGGPLAVTDANLLLGRLIPDYFPKIFGKSEKEPLDVDASRIAFNKLLGDINRETGRQMGLDEVVYGFIKVANETMCRPIRALTEARGHATGKHMYVSLSDLILLGSSLMNAVQTSELRWCGWAARMRDCKSPGDKDDPHTSAQLHSFCLWPCSCRPVRLLHRLYLVLMLMAIQGLRAPRALLSPILGRRQVFLLLSPRCTRRRGACGAQEAGLSGQARAHGANVEHAVQGHGYSADDTSPRGRRGR